MGHSRGDRLVRIGFEVYRGGISYVLGFELEIRRTVMDHESTPLPGGGAVGVAQGVWNRVLVPWTDSPQNAQAFGELIVVAKGAVEGRTDVTGSPGGVEHPGPLPERRLVPNVLVVEAGQLRDPVTIAIGVEPVNGADHCAPALATAGSPRLSVARSLVTT